MRERITDVLSRVRERLTGDGSADDPDASTGTTGRISDRVRTAVPTFVRRSYALKFGIVLFVLGASVALIGVGATAQFSGEVKQSVDGEYGDIAAQDAAALEGWNERNKRFTRMIARSDEVQSGDPDSIYTLKNELPKGTANVHYIEGTEGTVLSSTNRSAEGASLSTLDAPWTDAIGPGLTEVHVSEGYRSEGANGVSVIAYVAAVPEQDQRYVVYTVRLNSYGRFLSSPESSGVTMVVDRSGRIIFEETSSQLLIPYADGSSPVLEAARDQPVGTGGTTVLDRPTGALASSESPLPDGNVLVGYSAVPGTDWVLLVHAPTAEAYGFAETITLWGTLATLAGVLLITLGGAVLGRNTAVAIDRLTAKTELIESGDLDVDLTTNRIDNVGRLYEGFASMRDALREQIGEAMEARKEAETAREEAEATALHLESKADEYSDVMAAVAEGDLTRRMDPESRDEAMVEIAEAFNRMIDELESTITEVTAFATEVAASSEEVTAASEEVQGASEQVSASVDEIVDGAERQDEQLRTISEELNGLSTTIEEIASSANQVADVAERTAETGERGREAAEEAIDEMSEVEREAEETVEEMEDLQGRIERIEEITEFITDVAEQTNILALNANIEAARAGEAGEGFAVVADEVKSLAEETREAAENIDSLVGEIHEQTEATAEEVRETSAEVSESTEAVERTVDALEEIADFAEETNVGIQEISDATTEQASSTNQVVSTVEDVAAIAEQTSDSATNVAGAAQEQTSALTQMTDNAQALSGRAARLSETLDRFETVSAEGTTPAGTPGFADVTGDEDADGTGDEDADGTGDEDADEYTDADPLDGDGPGATTPDDND